MRQQKTTLLDGRVCLQQPETGLRVSSDSILLASAVHAQAGDAVLDMGCGAGAAGLCVMARCAGISLTGIDNQPDYIALAQANAEDNGCSAMARFECVDIMHMTHRMQDHVMCNPPYWRDGSWIKGPDETRNTALGQEFLGIQAWVDMAYKALKSAGSFNIVYPAKHLDILLSCLSPRFGAIEVFPFYSRAGDPAKRVVLRMLKDRKTPMTLHPPIVTHGSDGQHSQAMQAILREGQSLPIVRA